MNNSYFTVSKNHKGHWDFRRYRVGIGSAILESFVLRCFLGIKVKSDEIVYWRRNGDETTGFVRRISGSMFKAFGKHME